MAAYSSRKCYFCISKNIELFHPTRKLVCRLKRIVMHFDNKISLAQFPLIMLLSYFPHRSSVHYLIIETKEFTKLYIVLK